jgi:hypothetical protein
MAFRCEQGRAIAAASVVNQRGQLSLADAMAPVQGWTCILAHCPCRITTSTRAVSTQRGYRRSQARGSGRADVKRDMGGRATTQHGRRQVSKVALELARYVSHAHEG